MNNIEKIREVFRNCGLYAHAADDLLCERLAEVAGEAQPQASTYGGGYAVERHGDGWAIYCGRQQPRWRMGHLTECGPEVAAQIQAALNAAPQPQARPQAEPTGYAYRYPSEYGDGLTVLRFNNGHEVNGSRPIEAIPYWLGSPPAPQPQAEPVAWQWRVNGVHTEWSDVEPPEDAYDKGTLVPLYAAPPRPQASAEPLFLLHTGTVYGNERGEWETEANSGKAVDAYCDARPGQTIGLYPGPQPQPQASADDVALVDDQMETNISQRAYDAWQRIRASLEVGK